MAVQVHCCISFLRGNSNPTMSSLSELKKLKAPVFLRFLLVIQWKAIEDI